VSLWVAHTYCFAAAPWTSHLALTSAAKRCGKSRLIETISYLVHEPCYTHWASAAALFREIQAKRPILLMDEVDALFKGNPEMAEAVRLVLNGGAGNLVSRNNSNTCEVAGTAVDVRVRQRGRYMDEITIGGRTNGATSPGVS
jgi:hypothetical protein